MFGTNLSRLWIHFFLKVALVDVLRELKIEPDGMIGHSVGELGCAYADGGLTADETILAAYWRGRCVSEGNLPPGKMAAVGKSTDSNRFISEYHHYLMLLLLLVA